MKRTGKMMLSECGATKTLFRFFLVLVFLLLANNIQVQSGELDGILKSIDPGDQKAVNDDFLKETGRSGVTSIDLALPGEGNGSGFDAMGELDSIPRFRKEKKIAEKEKEITEAKTYDARMESECWCVFNPCLVLEAKLRDDLSVEAKRLAKRRAAAYDKRAKAKAAICRRWKEDGGSSVEVIYRQLEVLTVQRDEERVIEERLKQQRIVDENRKREAQIAEKAKIATVKAERERLRQEAVAKHRERDEARKLDRCRAQWDKGRNPCGCGHLAEAPGWVQSSRTCEK